MLTKNKDGFEDIGRLFVDEGKTSLQFEFKTFKQAVTFLKSESFKLVSLLSATLLIHLLKSRKPSVESFTCLFDSSHDFEVLKLRPGLTYI